MFPLWCILYNYTGAKAGDGLLAAILQASWAFFISISLLFKRETFLIEKLGYAVNINEYTSAEDYNVVQLIK